MDFGGFFHIPLWHPLKGSLIHPMHSRSFDKLPGFPLANIILTRDDERALDPVLHDGRKAIFIAKIIEVVAGGQIQGRKI